MKLHVETGTDTSNVVTCGADRCGRRGLGRRALNLEDGGQVMVGPDGWGEIEVVQDDGTGTDMTVTLFVCSPSCERRLAWALTAPTIGRQG